jgi:hypothetical protein
VIWEGLATILFWRAVQAFATTDSLTIEVNTPFAINLGLWAAFMVADEIFRTYRQQTSHALLFISQLLTLLALHLLPG